MPMPQGGPGRGRYLITASLTGSNGTRLQLFLQDARRDTELQLLDTLGPANAPHTLVFEMTHDKAAALAQRFQAEGSLQIEPDQPLSLSGGS